MLAAFGLSLIIAQSILLFNIIKYAGAVYLIYLGIRMLTDKKALNAVEIQSQNSVNYLSIYRDAILTNVLNPKVALFFIAFLPQFIDPVLKNAVLPFLLLGMTFIITGTAWCIVLALFASAIADKLKTNNKIAGVINKTCGLALIALGIKVALTGRKS
jgi:threonine/homoserine/homoserine lactone efflux protein